MTRSERTLRELIDVVEHGSTSPREWRSLIALASETLTIGRLADAVLAEDSTCRTPEDVRQLLVDIRRRARKRNELLISQFRELLAPLNAIGVRPIVMKGLARLLSTRLEGSRLLSDIDLLVPANRRNPSVEVFKELGYKIVIGADDDAVPPVLARSQDAGTVDLHTWLKPPDLGLGYDEIAPHCREIWFGDGVALLPGATAQLVLNVLHDQLNDRDYWRGFIDVRHLIDLGCLVREGIDWTLASSFFETGTRKRAFELQMLTAHHLLKIDIPKEYRRGTWAALQLLRRRFQWRFPRTRPLFTLLTIAADPPRASAPVASRLRQPQRVIDKIKERLERYIWRMHPGKL